MQNLQVLENLETEAASITEAEWEQERFYHVKFDREGNRIVKMDFYRLVERLKQLGFARYDVGGQSHIVRIDENVVTECKTTDVVDAFEDYLDTFGDNFPDGVMKETIKAKLYGSIGTFFSDHVLSRLRADTPIDFNSDTKDKAFFYYQNGFVEVTAKGAKLRPYSELKKMVWSGQIQERVYKPLRPSAYAEFCWTQFCNNIADNYIDKKSQKPNSPDRFLAFQTIVGYLIHAYFEGKMKAVIFTDSRISDDAAGRSGKTLLLKGVAKFKNSNDHSKSAVMIDGKEFETKDKFKWQHMALETKLAILNDITRNFDFEALYTAITEGISVQYKNEKPFPVLAKIAILSNRTVNIFGPSSKDRSLEFEMADYYSDKFGPDEEFGHWFFTDWDKDAWNAFDNFMMECVSAYLRHGLIKPEAINLLTRKLYEQTAKEFVDWFNDRKILHGERYEKKELYNSFLSEGENEKQFRWLGPRKFTEWLNRVADFQPGVFERVEEQRSNSLNYIRYYYTSEYLKKNPEVFNPSEEFDADWTPEKEAARNKEAEELFRA